MQIAMTSSQPRPSGCLPDRCVASTSRPAWAYTVYVTNERDNTISVVDLDQMKTVKTVPVGQRPRGITMTKDGSRSWSAPATTTPSRSSTPRRCASSATCLPARIPETFALHVSGNPLYVSNEDDNMVTVIDVPTRKVLAQIPTGVEPEGMAVSPDGKTIVNTSETTNMAHFIDYKTRKIVANVLVDPRPRFADVQARRIGGLGLLRARRHGQRDRPGEARR